MALQRSESSPLSHQVRLERFSISLIFLISHSKSDVKINLDCRFKRERERQRNRCMKRSSIEDFIHGSSSPELFESVIDVLVTEGKEQEEVALRVMENLKYIEEELKGKKFFGGATIGFTDIALGWTANLLGIIEEVTGIKFVDAEKFPQISQWILNFCDVPVIEANWPPRDKLVIKLQTIREKHITSK